jgi:hypothetical protein
MINEEVGSSYGEEEDEDRDLVNKRDKSDHHMESNQDEENQGENYNDNILGHFDEFGQFRYNKVYYDRDLEDFHRKTKQHIDLKDLSEQNFLDLIDAKNQDKRFYGWLHMHPLFDEEYDSHDDGMRERREEKLRRGSEKIELKTD